MMMAVVMIIKMIMMMIGRDAEVAEWEGDNDDEGDDKDDNDNDNDDDDDDKQHAHIMKPYIHLHVVRTIIGTRTGRAYAKRFCAQRTIQYTIKTNKQL